MKHAQTTHRIDLAPAQRYDPQKGRSVGIVESLMTFEGRPIGSSRQPLYDAARYLLRHELALPSDRIATYRGDTPSLSGVVGQVAKLSVEETDRDGLRLVPHRPFDRTRLGCGAGREGAAEKPSRGATDGREAAPLPM